MPKRESKNPANVGGHLAGGELNPQEGEVGGTASSPSRSSIAVPEPEQIVADTNPTSVGGVPGALGSTAGGGGQHRPAETLSSAVPPKPQTPEEKALIEKQTQQRNHELERNAQEFAYKPVPSQEEMLTGGIPVAEEKTGEKPPLDPELLETVDELMYDLAQQGNIGGG